MGIRNSLAMIKTLQSFLVDKSAVTAIEYALIAGIASIVIVPAVSTMGATFERLFSGSRDGASVAASVPH
jgi:Flp pilus assembly pilin Flp